MGNTNQLVVSTLSALYALKNHSEGEYAYCEEDKTFYCWQNNNWVPINIDNKGISMNLYDLNKTAVEQLPIMNYEDIIKKIEIIDNLKNTSTNNHYMLLCKEYNYYTIFEYETLNFSNLTFGQTVCDIISEIGNVYSIEPNEENNAIEIWIKPENEESPLVFYLFPYDMGVVYYR